MRTPTYLNDSAKTYFKKYASQVNDSDFELLILLANALSNYRSAQAAIDKEGILVPGAHGGLKQNPATYVLRDCHQQILRTMKALNLLPGANSEEEFEELID